MGLRCRRGDLDRTSLLCVLPEGATIMGSEDHPQPNSQTGSEAPMRSGLTPAPIHALFFHQSSGAAQLHEKLPVKNCKASAYAPRPPLLSRPFAERSRRFPRALGKSPKGLGAPPRVLGGFPEVSAECRRLSATFQRSRRFAEDSRRLLRGLGNLPKGLGVFRKVSANRRRLSPAGERSRQTAESSRQVAESSWRQASINSGSA